MTEQEIDVMAPGPELDSLVWFKVVHPDASPARVAELGWRPPPYSTNDGVALEVFKTGFLNKCFTINLYRGDGLDSGDESHFWETIITGTFVDGQPGLRAFKAVDETLAASVCKAALKAAFAEVETRKDHNEG